MKPIKCLAVVFILSLTGLLPFHIVKAEEPPNVIWVVVEDASPHISCYGETTIETPAIDRLAQEGIKFTRAFVTCPVCSPSRSAMVSGMFQTTLGAHHHRSQRVSGKWSAKSNPYAASYALPESIELIPELFRDAGYYVVNGGNAKTDYNFTQPDNLYDGKDWSGRGEGQPFFAILNWRGGKYRQAKVDNPVDPADVKLPPYYPDHPVIREDWAKYLNSWLYVDSEMAELRNRLESEGILDQTAIFFWTDHGISHARGKQFLYDEGIHVPLIARLPHAQRAGEVREDLVLHIDVVAASLRLAGIEIPDYVQGQPILDEDYRPRRRIFSARDRCDETVDMIRCVRTPKFKFIRNFLPQLSHMQPNRYKDGKEIVQTMRELYEKGELNELQSRIFQPTREVEELYDLEADPFETHNLLVGTADEQRAYRDTANVLRLALYQWMIDSADLGVFPEPILEELGKQAGSKYGLLESRRDSRLIWRILETIEAGEREDRGALVIALKDDHPAVRWWAATGIGTLKDGLPQEELTTLLNDEFAGVRIAAAQSLCSHGPSPKALKVLEKEVFSDNRVAGMFAIRGLELIGEQSQHALPTIEKAKTIPYDFTRRIADRLSRWLHP
ncbi:MAG: sulfatase-like hydrolase/transferase [Planctomycetaceae bacterium]|nr:sulfatase-like hydrolase/transferase [Planctomycetaceae bacterium]